MDYVHDLCVFIDSHLTFRDHINLFIVSRAHLRAMQIWLCSLSG